MSKWLCEIITALAIVALIGATGCSGRSPDPATAEPVALPPTRPPATVTPTPAPSPTPSPTPSPSPTATSTAPPSPTPAPSPSPGPTTQPTDTPSPAPTQPTLTPIDQLGDYVGQDVTVEGTVIDTASFSGGFKFTVQDDSGRVDVVMWHYVYDDCWDAPNLNLGVWIQATGEVSTFEGALQITPPWGSAVQVLAPAAAPAAPRPTSSLTASDEGQRVTIEGRVVRTEGLSSAVKVFVRDESGEVLVFIWRNVLDRIPDNVGLGTEGSRVRVTGAVAIYRGTLEVVPTLPYDVVVLEIP